MEGIITILNKINLTELSSSPNWIGYCERKKSFSICKIDAIIKALFNSFDLIDDYFLVTSVVKINGRFIEHDKKIKEYVSESEKKLISQGYLKMVDENDDYKDGFSKYILEASFYNKYVNISKDNLKYLFQIVMADDSIEGQCFLVLKKDNLIIYPHEDTGFGFIKIDKNKKDNLNSFKVNVSKLKEFVFVEKNDVLRLGNQF